MTPRQKKLYKKSHAIRDKVFGIFAFILTKMHLRANHITFLGVLLMIAFVAVIKINAQIALLLLIASLLCDGIDGVLARYQKNDSDKGKFIDVAADNFNTLLFVLGVAHAQIVSALYLIPYAYFMLLSKTFRVYINSFNHKSDWHFKAVAGLLPNIVNYFIYALFAGFILLPQVFILNYFFILGSAILCVDSIYYFSKIIRLKRQK